MASAGGKMLSAEERRRQKELEEARKAGLAAPEVDEEGNAINPHIPQFMASAPWYLSNEGPSLKHQRNWKESLRDDSNWYDRGAKAFQATTYRRGSCPNCGSASHKLKDCLERPRAKGAKWTGRDIAADDKLQNVNLASFDAKRDRWNGYEADAWTRTADDFEAVSQARAEARRREMLEEGDGGEDAAAAAREEEDLVQDDESEVFNKVEKRVRTVGGGSTGSVRNLRIREDTAKYLLNLDPNSAYYDPKSRSMREDPNPHKDAADKAFAGDNFVRTSGQVRDFAQMHAFAVTAYDKGQDVHLQATPSQLEAAYAQFKARKATAQHGSAAGLRAAYGDASARDAAQLRELSASEQYAEFDASGRVVRGVLRKAPARYEEDVFPGNHSSVWGSWWSRGRWGYACCRQTLKNAYCTGGEGQHAEVLVARNMQRALERESGGPGRSSEAGASDEAPEARRLSRDSRPSSSSPAVWGSETAEDVALDPKRLAEAVRREELRGGEGAEADDRKRGYNSRARGADDHGVTPEEMEAYRLKRSRGDDPLAGKEGRGEGGYDYV